MTNKPRIPSEFNDEEFEDAVRHLLQEDRALLERLSRS